MFFNNLFKPGKGVEKREPNEPRLKVYFEILSLKIGALIKLNILYLLLSLPFFAITWVLMGLISIPLVESIDFNVVSIDATWIDMFLRIALSYLFLAFLGQGPTTAGYIYIIKKYAQEHHVWLVSDYFKRMKMNFRQSIFVWIVDLLLFYLFVIAFRFYGASGIWILQGVLIWIGAVYVVMHIYMYHMMITFDLSVKNIFKNSLLLVFIKAPVNLFLLLIYIVIYIFIPLSAILNVSNIIFVIGILMFEILVVSPLLNFTVNFYIAPILKNVIHEKTNQV